MVASDCLFFIPYTFATSHGDGKAWARIFSATRLWNFIVLTPTMTIASPRQGTWLTRPDPWPQIESTLCWVPDWQVELCCTEARLWVPQLCVSSIKPFYRLGLAPFLSLCPRGERESIWNHHIGSPCNAPSLQAKGLFRKATNSAVINKCGELVAAPQQQQQQQQQQ